MDFNELWGDTSSSISLCARNGDDGNLRRLIRNRQAVDCADNRGWRPLHEAARYNRIACLRRLIKHGSTDVNWRSHEGETSLFLAASQGHSEAVEILLQHHADPNVGNNENETPLMLAVRSGNIYCVEMLLKSGANVNQIDYTERSALHQAAYQGLADTVTMLLKYGADSTARDDDKITPLFSAAQSGNLDCLKPILQNALQNGFKWIVDGPAEDGASPLMIAAQGGNVECIKYLLENGADPNVKADDGVMALHLAIQSGSLSCVKLLLPVTNQEYLLSSCWDPIKSPCTKDNEIRNYLLQQKTKSISPLHIAVSWERLNILEYLLQSGLEPDSFIMPVDYGCIHQNKAYDTALGMAVAKGDIRAATILLQNGAKLNVGNNEVHSILQSATCGSASVHMMKYLINSDATILDDLINAKDGFLSSVLWAAAKSLDTFKLLLHIGGVIFFRSPEEINELCFEIKKKLASLQWTVEHAVQILTLINDFLPRRTASNLLSTFNILPLPNFNENGTKQWLQLCQLLENPSTLANLCRMKIREIICKRNTNLIQSFSLLPLPLVLRSYLIFNESETGCNHL